MNIASWEKYKRCTNLIYHTYHDGFKITAYEISVVEITDFLHAQESSIALKPFYRSY